MGTIFLTIIGGIVAWLVRSYLNSQERLAVRNRLEATSAADPIELDDVRVANTNLVRLNVEAFQQAMELVQQSQQLNVSSLDETGYRMTYPQFVSAVRTALLHTIHTDTKSDAAAVTVQLGHVLDRIALSMLQKISSSLPDTVESPSRQLLTTVTLPLAQWWTLLSLAMDVESPRQRIPVLLQAMAMQSSSMSMSMGGTETDENALGTNALEDHASSTLTYDQVVELVSYLQASCQLAPDAQIVADMSRQYPLQRYAIGSPHQLVDLALATKAATTATANTMATKQQQPELQHEARLFDCQALEAILTSKSVCAWGECYRKAKP
jgi:hypothetical protein